VPIKKWDYKFKKERLSQLALMEKTSVDETPLS